ncbi:Hypothetical predicted protein [Octopus vulgaris]|uniref:Uncharacterized protein n=1 Tax=Octopus vulgaris TaxID=6645 RepID=A0AA36F192_OCTVU|nr:Hypothetical predicted protein [Octopus vulgaris]
MTPYLSNSRNNLIGIVFYMNHCGIDYDDTLIFRDRTHDQMSMIWISVRSSRTVAKPILHENQNLVLRKYFSKKDFLERKDQESWRIQDICNGTNIGDD